MSTLTVARGNRRLRLMKGERKRQETDEYESQRADALFFRGQTQAIVRHFFEIASQIGRLPSIMGREFFRAKVSHHAIPSFEEQVVFVHDVEQALARLNEEDAEVVALVGLLNYSLDDVAQMLGRSRSGVYVRYADSIDRLAGIFLEAGILQEHRPDRYIRYFRGKKCVKALPPRKPVASATPATYHIVGQSSAGRPFGGERCEA